MNDGLLDDSFKYYPRLTIAVVIAALVIICFGISALFYFMIEFSLENKMDEKYTGEIAYCYRNGGVTVKFPPMNYETCLNMQEPIQKKMAIYNGYTYWNHIGIIDLGTTFVEGAHK